MVNSGTHITEHRNQAQICLAAVSDGGLGIKGYNTGHRPVMGSGEEFTQAIYVQSDITGDLKCQQSMIYNRSWSKAMSQSGTVCLRSFNNLYVQWCAMAL